MKKKPTKIVELVIEENNEMLAIDAISLVSAPAIEENFVYFGKEKHNLTFAKVDEDKRMLVSPALIPNKQIFRYNPQTDSEYYVYFSKDTVRQAAELYLKHNNHHKATYEHQDRVSGVLTTESWIKEGDMDKSKMYGFDLPNGTWFVKMRIDNDDLWNKIKEGELKGLSIEGYFVDKMQKMSDNKPTNHEILSALNEIIRETNKPQKVELGSVAELQDRAKKLIKAMKDADTTWRKYQDYLTRADKPYVKMIDAYDELDPAIAFAEGTLKRFEKAAKELGVKATDNKDFKKLEADIKEARGIINIISSFEDPSNFQ
ncbi:MAG: putative peptidase [Prokaryotic dsDNA virus sp.]|nr:MAG: putative peptidase [Prokaryotic dsDNA virus sp.]